MSGSHDNHVSNCWALFAECTYEQWKIMMVKVKLLVSVVMESVMSVALKELITWQRTFHESDKCN